MGKEHFPLSIEEVSPDVGDEQVTVDRNRAQVGSPNSARMVRAHLTCTHHPHLLRLRYPAASTATGTRGVFLLLLGVPVLLRRVAGLRVGGFSGCCALCNSESAPCSSADPAKTAPKCASAMAMAGGAVQMMPP